MKVSEVTTQDIADFMRIDDLNDVVKREIEVMKSSAVEYIKSYTGLSDEEVDKHEDITQALFVLVTDMYDNRNFIIDYKSRNTNKTVECILGMHSINLL